MMNQYPYINENDLNLDYVLRKIKQLEQIVNTFVATETVTFADPILWNITTQYAKNTIVLSTSGDAYLSKQAVPANIQLDNADYWQEIFNFADYVRTANSNLTFNIEQNTTRATDDYAVDDWLLWDDVLYKVTSAIATDDLLVVGTNIMHFTVEDFIKAFMTWATNTIQQYKNDIDASEVAYRNQLAGDIASTTASLQAQLDAAIAGATVDSEVINARIGYDGTTFATLGDAIRNQVGDIHFAANTNGGLNITFEGGSLSGSDGSEVNNNYGFRSKFFRFASTKIIINNNKSESDNANDYVYFTFFKYDLDGTYINNSGAIRNSQILEVDPTKKYRILMRHVINGSANLIYYPTNADLLNSITIMEEDDNIIDLNNLIFKVPFVWEDGSLSTADGQETTSNYRVRTKYTNFGIDATISILNPLTATADPDDYLQLMFFEYDSVYTFNKPKSIRIWTSQDVVKFDVKKDCYYRMMIGHVVNGSNAVIHVANDMTLINNISVVRAQTTKAELDAINASISAIDTKYEVYIKNDRAAVKSFAHQGYHANYTNNTAQSIIAAGKHGFIGSQFNLRRTSDNIGVIHHDNTIYVNPNTFKITNSADPDAITYDIDQHTYADLSQYTYDNAYDQTQKVPTLAEMLAACKEAGIIPYILSGGMSSAFLANVIDDIHTYAFEKDAYIAGNWAAQVIAQGLLVGCKIEVADQSFPDINTQFINPNGAYHYLYEYAQNSGIAGMNLQLSAYTLGTREQDIAYIKALHEIGLTTSISIINSSSDYALFAPHSDRMISDDLMFSDIY